MRAIDARADDPSQDNTDELSSDEEGLGSEDVDSDEVEEFFGDEDGEVDEDIPQQQDFVAIKP